MRLLLSIFCLFQSTPLLAEQIVIRNYNDARDNYFYDQLYTGTVGESLYCAIDKPIPQLIGRNIREHLGNSL